MSRCRFTGAFGYALAAILIVAPALAQSIEGETAQHAFENLLATDRAFAQSAAGESTLSAISAAFSDQVIMTTRLKGLAIGKKAALSALVTDELIRDSTVAWQALGGGISADGQQGFTFGSMRVTRKSGDHVPMKYLAYWRDEVDGWRIVAYKRARGAQGQPLQQFNSFPPSARLAKPDEGDSRSHHAASLKSAEAAFSDEAQVIGLGAAFAKHGAPNAINLGGPDQVEVIVGAENIARHVAEGLPTDSSPLSWSAEHIFVADSGDLGVSIGYIRHNAANADGSEMPPIPFFTVWQRATPNDPWRYIAE
jgi:ketosteroid isomerase-like protein